MATSKQNPKDESAVPSLAFVLESEELTAEDAAFVLTPELREAVERGFRKCEANPSQWLRVTIPAQVAREDGTVWEPTDEQCKAILSVREQELRSASTAIYGANSFRRQTPKQNGKETMPRTMLYRIRKAKVGKKSA